MKKLRNTSTFYFEDTLNKKKKEEMLIKSQQKTEIKANASIVKLMNLIWGL